MHTSGPLRVDKFYGDNGKTEMYRLQAQVGITADNILKRDDAILYAAAPELVEALEDITKISFPARDNSAWREIVQQMKGLARAALIRARNA